MYLSDYLDEVDTDGPLPGLEHDLFGLGDRRGHKAVRQGHVV